MRLEYLPFVESFGGNLDWLGGYLQNRLSWWEGVSVKLEDIVG
jgi:hypothetical protein